MSRCNAIVFLSLTLTLSLALALSSAAPAQVVARQGGAPPPLDIEEFESPMVLELPLQDALTTPVNTTYEFQGVSRYYCADTVIRRLALTKVRRFKNSRTINLRLKGHLFVRPSHDRLATLRFDLLAGETKFGSASIPDIDAEEETTRIFETEINLTTEKYGDLLVASETAQLVVTMTVRDNN